MPDAPLTRPSLLLRLRDPSDAQAWREFVDLYSALVYGYARRRGLQDADAADVMQDVLRSVAVAASRLDYDRARGTFRAWLYTITRNKLLNFLDGQRTRVRGSGDSATHQRLAEEADRADAADDLWELEWQRQVAALAMERVRGQFQPNTWQAFLLTSLEGRSAPEAAAQLGMSPGAIYVAKSRVLARLREEIQQLQADT